MNFIFDRLPKGAKPKPLAQEFTSSPKDAIYTMRTSMFSGYLEGNFGNSKLGIYFYKGRPIFTIYQSKDWFEFGQKAIDFATKDQGSSRNCYSTSDVDPDILKCFCSLLSPYPIFRNFYPQMLVIDELFSRMVQEKFTGCIYISTLSDQVLLFVHDGMILEWEEGKIINRYPIDESPVTKDMAKAVALMSDERAGIDIYEMPENLYSDLTSFEYGVTFKTTKSLLILKDALSKIAGDELKGKSVDFDRALDENSADINNIEEFVTNLEKHLTVDISRKILQGLTEKLMVEIAEFKKS